MTLPTAVASGVEPKPDDEFVPVRPLRAGVIGGLLAAVYLVVVYWAQPVPGRFVRFAGGRGDAVGRYGGARLVWQPPPGYDLRRVTDELDAHGTTTVLRSDGTVEILLGGVTADEIHAVAEGLTQKRLEFHEVLETDEMKRLVSLLALPMKDQWPLDAEVDQWRPEGGGGVHTDYYLRARTTDELGAALDKARSLGWSPPPAAHVGYERVETENGTYWRTYMLADAVGFDGEGVANAVGTYDPNTNRPVVSVDMTREGAQIFGDLTTRIVGKKLAICSGDEVRSAPVINGTIRGGRAVITMGGGDPAKQERDRDVLVKVLKAGSLPAGGALVSQDVMAPTDTTLQMWLGRALLGLAGGVGIGAFVWWIVRALRPVRRRIPAIAPGPLPVSRVLVTLLAPAAVLALSYLPIPTVSKEALARDHLNLGAIGLTPLIGAYLLAELLAVTVWRKRRHAGSEARRPIRDAFVVLAILLTALQAWTLTTYLQSITYDDLMEPSAMARLEVVVAFGAATAFLAGVATIIRNWGLGNGYAALIAGGWAVLVVKGFAHVPNASMAFLVFQAISLAVPVAIFLRWRIYGVGERRLRVPTSGIIPLAQGAGVVLVFGALAWINDNPVVSRTWDAVEYLHAHAGAADAVAAVFVVLWSAAFAWPPSTGVSWRSWGRATMLSLAALAVVSGMVALGSKSPTIVDPITMAIIAAFALDAFDDWRARRIELDPVWTVHSAQRAEAVERQLRDAGIPCHLASAHVRTILGGFGAFAAIDVLVPTEHVPAARTLLNSN
ncbi:MAG: DUF2007 domain-containing protein [Deltaproteobacteria bacterium]|nr:DUF2007 domain-containing protein [Deltaproteobacteria bacterium]